MNAERTDFIAEAITEWFGPRCPDYAEGCAACDAWKQRDDMLAALESAVALSDKKLNPEIGRTGECQRVYDQCAAAIARARGDQS